MKKVAIDGRDILVVNVNGNYFACDDTCTHAGASLSEGNVKNSTVICGWHGAEFSCETGKMEKFPVKINDLKSYTVSIESEDVFIEI
tara:strand:- start:712 stop:972 length:261 start_codon:yes stop_codon:yes gene_type:complete